MEGSTARQGAFFVLVSGLGWCMDFGFYTVLTSCLSVPVAPANMLASMPAVTFVFVLSTRHIFATQKNRWGLGVKYAAYLAYQAVLVTSVSLLAGWLYVQLQGFVLPDLLAQYLNILVKVLITPLTMACNFFMMKFLAERC